MSKKEKEICDFDTSSETQGTPFTRAKKIGTARQIVWHRADDFKARHSHFSTCKRIGPKCNVAPVLKILGVPRLPPGGNLGTGKRGTVPKIWRAVPIFLVRVNGVPWADSLSEEKPKRAEKYGTKKSKERGEELFWVPEDDFDMDSNKSFLLLF